MFSYTLFGLTGILVLLSSIFHEMAHGWMARWLGDSTARLRGRLTLDPRVHFDLFGWLIVPVLIWVWLRIPVAYARPAPVDTRRLHPVALAVVGLSGPVMNGVIAVLLSLGFRGFFQAGVWGWTPVHVTPPVLDALKLGIVMNIVVGIANLVPFPPLDGSRIVISILPPNWGRLWHRTHVLWIAAFLVGAAGYPEPIRQGIVNLVGPVFHWLTGASMLV